MELLYECFSVILPWVLCKAPYQAALWSPLSMDFEKAFRVWAHWQDMIVHSPITEVKQLWAQLVLGMGDCLSHTGSC